MKIVANEETAKVINSVLDMINEENYFFKPIYDYLQQPDLTIIIKNEQESLTDVLNEDSTLTEFRAYLQYETIVIYHTRYETLNSIVWILLHEIMHYVINYNTIVYCMFKVLNQNFLVDNGIHISLDNNYQHDINFINAYKKDSVHEHMPEEKLCNNFATFLLGYNCDRKWWRKQIVSIDKSEVAI